MPFTAHFRAAELPDRAAGRADFRAAELPAVGLCRVQGRVHGEGEGGAQIRQGAAVPTYIRPMCPVRPIRVG